MFFNNLNYISALRKQNINIILFLQYTGCHKKTWEFSEKFDIVFAMNYHCNT